MSADGSWRRVQRKKPLLFFAFSAALEVYPFSGRKRQGFLCSEARADFTQNPHIGPVFLGTCGFAYTFLFLFKSKSGRAATLRLYGLFQSFSPLLPTHRTLSSLLGDADQTHEIKVLPCFKPFGLKSVLFFPPFFIIAFFPRRCQVDGFADLQRNLFILAH